MVCELLLPGINLFFTSDLLPQDRTLNLCATHFWGTSPLHAAHRRGPTAYTTFLHTAENIARYVIEQSLARDHSAGIWACRSRVSRLGFQRLAQSMLSGGYIQRITPYEECVATWAQQPV